MESSGNNALLYVKLHVRVHAKLVVHKSVMRVDQVHLTRYRAKCVEPWYKHNTDQLGKEHYVYKVTTHYKQTIHSLYSDGQYGSNSTEHHSS